MTEILRQVSISKDRFYLGQKTTNLKEPESTIRLDEKAEEEGYKIGFHRGMKDGLQQAREKVLKETKDQSLQLQYLLENIPLALNESRLALKTEITELVLMISQQFFVYQQQNKTAIAQQISAALHHVNDKQRLTLVLHPKDLKLLQQGELAIDFSHCQHLNVVADESLSLGGCLIRSEHGMFDGSIHGQIDRLKRLLLQIKNGDIDV